MKENVCVDANYRFIAAYQEVNARITQRQHALVLYVTLVVSLLASLVALKSSSADRSPIEWLVLGFPMASMALAFLNYKVERAITNLRRFLSALEQLGDAHKYLPSYNTDPQWSEDANKARRFHDYAAAGLVIGSNGLGIIAFIEIYPERMQDSIVVLSVSTLVTLISVAILLVNPRWSYKPEVSEKNNAQ
jgi:hypothetical protein